MIRNYVKIGSRYGKLTVVDFVGYKEVRGQLMRLYRLKCDCGNVVERTVPFAKSCGCTSKEHLKKICKSNITHNMSHTRLYRVFEAMRSRCYRAKDIHYNAYGGRGIKICDEWLNDRGKFFEWAKQNGYRDDLTIERIDVNGDYCPENCTWIPMSEQYKNKQMDYRLRRKVYIPEIKEEII